MIESENSKAHLNQGLVKLFFMFVVFANILVNVEHGCIPACTISLREIFDDNTALGTLGSIVYVGLLIGSFVAPPIFHHMSAKRIILICLISNGFALLLFSFFK